MSVQGRCSRASGRSPQCGVVKNKTRALGVSNFCSGCLECLAKPAGALTPAVNQFKYHIGMGTDPIGLLSYCNANGIVPQAAASPLLCRRAAL